MENGKIIGIFGIGIFLCLILQGISSLFEEICRSSFLFFDIHPFIVLGFSEYFSLIIVLILFGWLINKARAYDFKSINVRKAFLYSVTGYIITQLIGFALPLIFGLFETMDEIERSLAYHRLLRDHGYIHIVITISSWLLRYAVIALIILKEIKNIDSAVDD